MDMALLRILLKSKTDLKWSLKISFFILNQPCNKHHQDSISLLLHELKWKKETRLILLFKMLNNLISIPSQHQFLQ